MDFIVYVYFYQQVQKQLREHTGFLRQAKMILVKHKQKAHDLNIKNKLETFLFNNNLETFEEINNYLMSFITINRLDIEFIKENEIKIKFYNFEFTKKNISNFDLTDIYLILCNELINNKNCKFIKTFEDIERERDNLFKSQKSLYCWL